MTKIMSSYVQETRIRMEIPSESDGVVDDKWI